MTRCCFPPSLDSAIAPFLPHQVYPPRPILFPQRDAEGEGDMDEGSAGRAGSLDLDSLGQALPEDDQEQDESHNLKKKRRRKKKKKVQLEKDGDTDA